MSRMFGTVVRGVRAPIFREGDDVVKGTVETVLKALKENKKELDSATKNQIKKDLAALKRLTHAAKPERMTPQLTQELIRAREALEHSAAGILQEGR